MGILALSNATRKNEQNRGNPQEKPGVLMSQRLKFPRLCGVTALLLVAGCETNSSQVVEGQGVANHAQSTTQSPQSEASSSTDEVTEDDGSLREDSDDQRTAIEFVEVDAAGLEAEIAKHAGKVVLVDFWALWCTNCLEEFPETVRLSRVLESEGLVVLGLNFDSPRDAERMEAAAGFCERQGASFRQLVCSVIGGSKAMDEFGLEEGLPHYRVYSREGQLVESFNGKPENLEETLRTHLALPSQQ